MTTPLTDTTADGSIRIGLTICKRDDGRWEIEEDFRADFPGSEAEYGNSTIAKVLRERLDAAGVKGIEIDSEFSCLWAIGRNLARVQRVEEILYEMRDEGVLS